MFKAHVFTGAGSNPADYNFCYLCAYLGTVLLFGSQGTVGIVQTYGGGCRVEYQRQDTSNPSIVTFLLVLKAIDERMAATPFCIM